MKCQKCGKDEVNFHYSSYVNGCVTETHLCSECASKAGYDFGQLLDAGNILDSFFPSPRFGSGFPTMPVFGFSTARPFAVLPLAGLQPRERVCDETCAAPVAAAPPAEVDAEMQKRREINAIREQMRIAAENEDFEKAAELRDKIKKME